MEKPKRIPGYEFEYEFYRLNNDMRKLASLADVAEMRPLRFILGEIKNARLCLQETLHETEAALGSDIEQSELICNEIRT